MLEHAPSRTDETWRPRFGRPAILLRWKITEWCNYRCPYCPQTHDRRAPKGGGMTAHAFDNFPMLKWQDAFDRHFTHCRLSLVISGGEAMVDRKSMGPMLNFLSAKESVECIRLDTNAWWTPELFADLKDRSKIILMCTFHPSQTEESAFIARLTALRHAGFVIGLVNYVMDKTNLPLFKERQARFAEMGLVLNPNPLWNSHGLYAPAEVELLHEFLPTLDFNYRSGASDPNGLPCRFPSLAFEMDYRGEITVGCMPELRGSLFDDALPARPSTNVPCPLHVCACLDKYSFLESVDRNTTTNPLAIYSATLKDHAASRASASSLESR
jgi:hypothetical protein